MTYSNRTHHFLCYINIQNSTLIMNLVANLSLSHHTDSSCKFSDRISPLIENPLFTWAFPWKRINTIWMTSYNTAKSSLSDRMLTIKSSNLLLHVSNSLNSFSYNVFAILHNSSYCKVAVSALEAFTISAHVSMSTTLQTFFDPNWD